MTNDEFTVGRLFERAPGVPRTMAILLYDGMPLQDWVGPYTALNSFARGDLNIWFVAKARGPVRDDAGRAAVTADRALAEVDGADVLLVPGGDSRAAVADLAVLEWVARVHAGAEVTASVCSGSLVLAAAGVLRGRRATTVYWGRDGLPAFGATYVPEHIVEDGTIVTAAGASGGIELGLRLAERLAGRRFAEAMQLLMEYAPTPVYGYGDAATAPAELHARAVAVITSDGRMSAAAPTGVGS